ncbi:MAG: DUF1223 domain-containing protein [Aestuariivita sp.]|nr:DUF1223 domain-containing protein [Aestuariivita sp.]
MKQLFFSACMYFAVMVPVYSEDVHPVVVELFTSQGCSSCPPADYILHHLAQRDDIIALSLHVDYWDYIGWKDQFASPVHSARQRGYAIRAGRHIVFTPEMILNGADSIIGTHAMELNDRIRQHALPYSGTDIDVSLDGQSLRIRAQTKDELEEKLSIQVVRYDPERDVFIQRGENAGLKMRYVNVVHSWSTVAYWDGKNELDLEVVLEGDDPAVILIQEGDYGEIVAAAKLE